MPNSCRFMPFFGNFMPRHANFLKKFMLSCQNSCGVMSCQIHASCGLMSCHFMPLFFHAVSCHAISCHFFFSCRLMFPFHAISCHSFFHAVSCHAVSCHFFFHAVSCHAISCHFFIIFLFMPFHAKIHAISCKNHAISCENSCQIHAMPFHAFFSHVMSCGLFSCHVMPVLVHAGSCHAEFMPKFMRHHVMPLHANFF